MLNESRRRIVARTLTEEQVKRAGELIALMDQRRTVIGMTTPGDAERVRAWEEYGTAQKELLEIMPLATEPLD
jgi:hypothetical protein